MAPPAGRSEDLKKKLAEAKEAKKLASKSPQEKAKEKKAEVAKAKADKIEQDKAREAEAAAKKAAAPPLDPGPFAPEGEPLKEIGIHLGITCDGCGDGPPLIGRVYKCKDCQDFDLCEKCYPDRLDKQREAVAAAAGMPGKGRHPGAHKFGPRLAKVQMTEEEAAKERKAAEEDKKLAAAVEEARALRAKRAAETGQPVIGAVPEVATQKSVKAVTWRPLPQLAAEYPMAEGPPISLRPS